MKRFAAATALVLVLACATSARSQELNYANTSPARPDILLLRTGVDHAFLAELGYRRVLSPLGHQLFVGGDAALPWAKLDFGDYRLRATAGSAFGSQHWKVAGWLAPTLRGTKNAASRMTAFGVDVRATAGYYSSHWFGAGEAGFDWVAATHVTFSRSYRTTVYDGAQNGWYGLPGGTTYAGLQTGVSFSGVDLVLRAGHPGTPQLEDQTIPFYAMLGVNIALR